MMNITVIAESTPGPIAINCATYVGYKQGGYAGSVAATLGMVFPSFVIIYVISVFLDRFLEITWIAHAFQGIKIAVGILILDAGLKMLKKMPKKQLPRVITLLVTILLKTALKNPYVQAVLRGLKPCMIGIILATGVYMILKNGIVIREGVPAVRQLLLTIVLGTVYFGSRKVLKGGISPIQFICLSAAAGIAVYGV